jgi:hypothetical protein
MKKDSQKRDIEINHKQSFWTSIHSMNEWIFLSYHFFPPICFVPIIRLL